jgi:hypothetical protein
MNFDVPEMIGAVTRTLTTRDRDGRPAWVSVHARTYDTSIDDLWNALTDPERIPRWFLPVTGALQEGGHYQLRGTPGHHHPLPASDLLAVTWEYDGDVSWVTVRLTSEGDEACRLSSSTSPTPRSLGPLRAGRPASAGTCRSWASRCTWRREPPSIRASSRLGQASPDRHELIRRSSDDWCQALDRRRPIPTRRDRPRRRPCRRTRRPRRDGCRPMHVRRARRPRAAPHPRAARRRRPHLGDIVRVIQAEFAISQPAVSRSTCGCCASGCDDDAGRGPTGVLAAGAEPAQVDAWLAQFRSRFEPQLEALATEVARGKRSRRTSEGSS